MACRRNPEALGFAGAAAVHRAILRVDRMCLQSLDRKSSKPLPSKLSSDCTIIKIPQQVQHLAWLSTVRMGACATLELCLYALLPGSRCCSREATPKSDATAPKQHPCVSILVYTRLAQSWLKIAGGCKDARHQNGDSSSQGRQQLLG